MTLIEPTLTGAAGARCHVVLNGGSSRVETSAIRSLAAVVGRSKWRCRPGSGRPADPTGAPRGVAR
jgi:hypothetical protein